MSKPGTRRRSFAAVVAVGALVALAACGSSSEDGKATPEAASTTSGSPSASTPKVTPSSAAVPDSLDFTAETVAGDSFAGSSVAGKPVVLWFWAPWCPVCRSQAPQVTQLAADHGDEVAVIGVGSLDSGSAIAGFAEDVGGPLHLSDPEGKLWKKFRISQQSSFVVLDAAGNEVLRTGYDDDDELAETVEKLVG